VGLLEQVVDQAQHLDPPAAGRHRVFDAAAIENGPDAISMAGEQTRQRGDKVDEHGPLERLRLHRAKVHRGTEVEQKPPRDLAILRVLAHVRDVHSRGDVPIDIANVVSGLIFAQVGKVDPVAVEQAAVVALELAVQSANDVPVETLQDALRR
jgi:hypothetical protein